MARELANSETKERPGYLDLTLVLRKDTFIVGIRYLIEDMTVHVFFCTALFPNITGNVNIEIDT